MDKAAMIEMLKGVPLEGMLLIFNDANGPEDA
jgi:hypothetical protein